MICNSASCETRIVGVDVPRSIRSRVDAARAIANLAVAELLSAGSHIYRSRGPALRERIAAGVRALRVDRVVLKRALELPARLKPRCCAL